MGPESSPKVKAALLELRRKNCKEEGFNRGAGSGSEAPTLRSRKVQVKFWKVRTTGRSPAGQRGMCDPRIDSPAAMVLGRMSKEQEQFFSFLQR